jgi:hypothetical protein
MFITYPDGTVQTRYFDDVNVLGAWLKTMDTMQSLAAIEKYSLFTVANFPSNVVLTT